MGGRMMELLNTCLKEGHFIKEWKTANLILLHKDGKPDDEPSSYRPICLLDELEKLLKRIVANRINEHLATAGPDLHVLQFGFRPGTSTNDAILFVKRFVRREILEGRVVLAVSLDITNAFNSLPWNHIMSTMREHSIPGYLRRIIANYLSDRWLNYRDRDGTQQVRSIRRGVPQGSVLGPLLWNIGFNGVLSGVTLPAGCVTVCYADDTLVLAAGSDWDEAKLRMDRALAEVVGKITSLGLMVAPKNRKQSVSGAEENVGLLLTRPLVLGARI